MRFFTAILLLLIASSSIKAQVNNEMFPFVYTAYGNIEYEYDQPEMIIMDLNTRDTLYSIESSCPGLISPDRRYVSYSDMYSTGALVLDLISGDVSEFLPNSLGSWWSPDSTSIANLTYDIQSDFEKILTVYHTPSFEGEKILRSSGLLSIDWNGENLFVFLEQEDSLKQFSWNGTQFNLINEVVLPDLISPAHYISPDGQAMIISSLITEENFEREFFIINMLSGEVIPMQEAPHNQQIRWSPEGTGFSMTTGNYDMAFYDIATNTSRVLVSSANIINNIKWSPDGRFITYNEVHMNDDNSGSYRSIHIYDTETGLTDEIRAQVDRYASSTRWMSDTQFIYTYARSGAPHTLEANNLNDLYWYDVTTGEHIRLTETPDVDEYLGCLVG